MCHSKPIQEAAVYGLSILLIIALSLLAATPLSQWSLPSTEALRHTDVSPPRRPLVHCLDVIDRRG